VTVAAFDEIAARYDDLWTRSTVGCLQREAVWRRIGRLFSAGQSVLDLGCGTGEDALRLMRAGVRVRAIDASPEMVRIARRRGVDAETVRAEECGLLCDRFDGIISNFGALNCVEDLGSLRDPLAGLISPGGHLAVCILGRFCAWELVWNLLRRDQAKALRRFGKSAPSSLGVRVFYPSAEDLISALRPAFALLDWRGVGLCVPPSYVTPLPDRLLEKLDAWDRRIAHWPLLRGCADHRLFVFARSAS